MLCMQVRRESPDIESSDNGQGQEIKLRRVFQDALHSCLIKISLFFYLNL